MIYFCSPYGRDSNNMNVKSFVIVSPVPKAPLTYLFILPTFSLFSRLNNFYSFFSYWFFQYPFHFTVESIYWVFCLLWLSYVSILNFPFICWDFLSLFACLFVSSMFIILIAIFLIMTTLNLSPNNSKISDSSVLESIDCSHHSVWDLHLSYNDEWISIEAWMFLYYVMTLWILLESSAILTDFFWHHSCWMKVRLLALLRPPMIPHWLGGAGVPHDCLYMFIIGIRVKRGDLMIVGWW